MDINWIDWDGSTNSRGLPPGVKIEDYVLVQFADEDRESAERCADLGEPAGSFRWEHRGHGGDIIAYAVMDPEED